MIGIICDSAADTPVEIIKKYNIRVIPLKVVIEGKSYDDNVDINPDTLLKYMENNFAKTSMPSYQEVRNQFEAMINEGIKEIIAVTVSKQLSGVHNLCLLISRELMTENPDLKITVVDSISISIGAGLMVYYAAKLLEQNKSYDEIVTLLRKKAKDDVRVYYTIPTLKYLKAGGRIGKVQGTIGELLNIKPVISVDPEGVYYTISKSRGMKNSIEDMYNNFLKFVGDKKFTVAIYKSGNQESTIQYIDELTKRVLRLPGYKGMFKGTIGTTLTVHVGDGLVGIAAIIED